MTRKDYVAIAKCINDTRYALSTDVLGEQILADGINVACSEIAGRCADIMKADNARFDRARFLTACGVQS